VRSEYCVYAIVNRHTRLPAPRAVDSTSGLEMVPWRELAAVTGRPRDHRATATIEAVHDHEMVVEAVRREGPALPVRFGTLFPTADALGAALAARYETLAADLDRLGDKVELALTALWAGLPDGDAAPTLAMGGTGIGVGPGARYLLTRAAQFRRDDALNARAQAVARELERGVGGLVIGRRLSVLPTARIALRATYLLEPVSVGAFRDAVAANAVDGGVVRVVMTGPWPPYSFVTRPEEEGAAARDSRFVELAQLLADATRGRLG